MMSNILPGKNYWYQSARFVGTDTSTFYQPQVNSDAPYYVEAQQKLKGTFTKFLLYVYI